MEAHVLPSIYLGQKHIKPFAVTSSHQALFAEITGDTHSVHARGVVFGALLWGYIGTALTEMFGENYLAIDQASTFRTQFCVDMPASIHLTVTEVRQNGYRAECIIWLETEKRRKVLQGSVFMHKIL